MHHGKLLKRISHITKHSQYHMDDVLKVYDLSSGSYPFLLALSDEEGINLEKISRKISVDKAMSTRTIQKLIGLGYLEKISDLQDSRACKLFLTDKAKEVIPQIKKEVSLWIDNITLDLSQEELKLLEDSLDKIMKRAEQKRL